MIAATCGGLRVVCVYAPNGRIVGSSFYQAKLAWFDRLARWLAEAADPAEPLALGGDLNAPEDIDVWDPQVCHGGTHVSAAERDAFARLCRWGLIDVYRQHHPEPGRYTWLGLPRRQLPQELRHAHRPPAGDAPARRAHGVGGDRPRGAQRQAHSVRPRALGDRPRPAGAPLRGGLGVRRRPNRGAPCGRSLMGTKDAAAGFPIEPMLAKLATELPAGDGWLFEPKWDGFRAIVFRDRDRFYIQSRELKPLDRYFPELEAGFRTSLPARCVVDGEIVIATERGLDFDALQLRLHPAAWRVKKLAAETPASFVAFDLLAGDGRDLRSRPQAERRLRLEQALGRTTGGVHLTPCRRERSVAEAWFHRFEGAPGSTA